MTILKYLVNGVRFLGVDRVLMSIWFAAYRDRWTRSRQRPSVPPAEVGIWIRTREVERGLEVTFQAATLEITFLTDDMVRLRWSPGRRVPDYAIARHDWPPVEVSMTQAPDHVDLRSSKLTLRVANTGAAAYYDSTMNLLRQDDPPRRVNDGWIQDSCLRPGERIFGLGERSSGLNLRPGHYRLWNADPAGGYLPGHDPLYMSIPVYCGLHADGAYMVFYNNPHDGWLSLDDKAEIGFSAGELITYFIAGPLHAALQRFLELTGRPTMPPRWALGLHQSRWGYASQTEIQAVADSYRFHDLPLSAIHLDIDHMDEYRVFTADQGRFPDLAGMAKKLNAAGVHLVAILDPGVKQADDYDVYTSGSEGGHLCRLPDGRIMRGLVWPGWVGFPDFTHPATRQWWGEFYRRLLARGIDGFWHDMNEPTCFAAWGPTTFPSSTLHDLDGMGGDHTTAHNLYGLQMDRAGYEALRRLRPDHRPFLLTRSGWAGVQRYAWHWTGDTVSSWNDLRMTVPSLLGLSLSGILFSGSDIGGFNGHPDAELYLRWFALGCLVPFCRVHSALTSPPREPWRYGEDMVQDIRRLLQLRHSLMPYLYTLAAEAAEQGQPWLRPVFWFDPSDSALWEVDDSFGIGPHLLAAPILHPDRSSRDLLLPSGGWYDFWDEEPRLAGGGQATLPGPASRPPLLIREGSILSTRRGPTLILTLCLPDSGEALGNLYSDPGDGYGQHRWDRFRASGEAERWKLTWTSSGSYPFDYEDVEIRVPPARGRIAEMVVDGHPVPPGVRLPPFERADITLAI